MDHTAAALRIVRGANSPNRPADGHELLITRHLLDALAIDGLEHHEIAHQVEQMGRSQQPCQQVSRLQMWRG
jgi:hypothetical protein